MRRQERIDNLSGLLALVLFVMFAACILFVLLTGAEVVQKLTHRDQESYDRRTIPQYIATKVRQSDAAGMIFVADFSSVEADTQGNTLFLNCDVEGETYCTRIYCWDGTVRELFSEAGEAFLPEDGEKIMELQGLHFSLENSILYVELEYENGESEQLVLHLRSEGAAA